MTECSQTELEFQGVFSREVIGRFDGGQITSDGGSLLLREVERRTGILRRFADCFTDHRAGDRIEHSVEELVAQRIYALALGYEDLNDHEQLRADPLVAVLAGKRDPEGKDRKQERDRGKACPKAEDGSTGCTIFVEALNGGSFSQSMDPQSGESGSSAATLASASTG